jgi:hypothetical protein
VLTRSRRRRGLPSTGTWAGLFVGHRRKCLSFAFHEELENGAGDGGLLLRAGQLTDCRPFASARSFELKGQARFSKSSDFQEDSSPKAPLPSAEQFLAARLRRLEPESELIITDPYFLHQHTPFRRGRLRGVRRAHRCTAPPRHLEPVSRGQAESATGAATGTPGEHSPSGSGQRLLEIGCRRVD